MPLVVSLGNTNLIVHDARQSTRTFPALKLGKKAYALSCTWSYFMDFQKFSELWYKEKPELTGGDEVLLDNSILKKKWMDTVVLESLSQVPNVTETNQDYLWRMA